MAAPEIRPARPEELPRILEIYAAARAYMTAHGNPTQWQAGFLPRSLLEADLSRAEIEARVRFQEQYFHTEIRL